MDYLQKSLNKLSINWEYAEIDSILASCWYLDFMGNKRLKNTKLAKQLLKYQKKFKGNYALINFKNNFVE